MSRPMSEAQVPYRLYGMLRQKRIPQKDMCAGIRFAAGARIGQPIAISTLNALLVQRVWPRTIEAKVIQDAVAEFLRAKGFSEEEIADAWTPDGDVFDHGPPLHRPLLNTAPKPKTTAEDPFELPEPAMLSSTARDHFNIVRQPFQDDVQGPDDVFLSKDQRYIRESMYFAAKQAGLLAIVGESGSGKSTLRRDLIERIRRDNEPVVVIHPQTIDKGKLSAEHICDAIIADLSTEAPKRSLEGKARQVQRILSASARTGNSHVLIIEEAHDLTESVLKYLKRFWELEEGFKRLLGIVLVAQPELARRLDLRVGYNLREFIQRIEVARLKPLDNHLEEYLAFKFKRVGLSPVELFDKGVYDAIRMRLTKNDKQNSSVESYIYPLAVHNLVIKCLNQAAELGLPKVNGDLVGRV